MEARFAIFESTLTGPKYSFGNFRFLKAGNNLSLLKIFEKITKNVTSRKLQGFEQSYLEARFAIFEIFLTGPNFRVGNFRFCEKKSYKFSKNFLKKITKNVISRKLQGFEQSYLLARFVTPQSNLTALNYKVDNFKFWKLILKKSYKFSKNFLKKFKKTYLENSKDLSSHVLRRDSRSLIVLWQYPSTGLGISGF